MARLDVMTLQDLTALARLLDRLATAGGALPGAVFDLTPGRQVTVRLGDVMPGAPMVAQPVLSTFDLGLLQQTAGGPPVDVPGLLPLRDDPAPQAAAGVAGQAPAAGPEDLTAAGAGDTWQQVGDVAAALLPQAGLTAKATLTGHAQTMMGLPWSDAEDEQLVAIMADVLAAGGSRGEGARRAADLLERPVHGTQFRADNKLRARIALAVEARRAAARGAAVSGPAVVAAPPPVVAVADEAPPPLDVHVAALATEDDLALMRLAVAMPWKDAAAALEMSPDHVKARYDLLTDHRRFRREDVLAALEVMFPDAEDAA